MALFPFPADPDITDPVIPPNTSAIDSRPLANDGWQRDYLAIQNLANSAALLNIAYFGAGRFVGSEIDPDTEPYAGTGLTLRVPNGTYLIDGRIFAIDEVDGYLVISDIVADAIAGVEVFVSINPDNETQLITDDDWQFATFPTSEEDLATVAGKLHLGTAVTDATTVSDFTPSTRDGYGIIRPRGYGAGGGGGGDVTTEQFDAYKAIVAAQFAAVIERLNALEAATGTGTTTTATESPLEFQRRAMVLASQVNDRVDDFPEYPGSVYVRDVTGSGEETTTQTLPDVRDGGDWSV